MFRFDIAAVLIAWAAGGWFFLWVTTRRREVGLGYGWLLRSSFLVMVAVAFVLGGSSAVSEGLTTSVWLRQTVVFVFACVGFAALAVSVTRRSAGVAGQRANVERKLARVAAMTGMPSTRRRRASGDCGAAEFSRRASGDCGAAEFPPGLDLAAACAGLLAAVLSATATVTATAATTATVTATTATAWVALLAVARILAGALFLGAVTDAMLLGHWYLVQPGLPRAPLLQLVRVSGWMWLPETVVMLLPTGMISVLNGSINDGYNGLLGWFWAACTVTTVGLVLVTLAALRERQYSAVMAATGLMYLAIVTAFGQDIVARILLAA